jgi:hypothetical protein
LGAAAPAVATNAAAIAASPSLFINDPFVVRTRLSTIRRYGASVTIVRGNCSFAGFFVMIAATWGRASALH